MDNLGGQTIKGYELRDELGQGGFGVVYRAYQPVVGREVAIKVILPDHASRPDFIRRFEVEAQLVARLEHPHIVPLYDYWRDPEGAYLVMRLLKGGSLRAALLGNPWTLNAALKLIDQIAGALATAHNQGVIHRDLKPDNILLDGDGNAYLSDFGIAKDTNDDAATSQDFMSPKYAAPEQFKSEPLSPQTDLYSFGVILYELLTGHHPFPGLSVSELVTRILTQPLPSIHDQLPTVPTAVDAVVQKATAKSPIERYANAPALATALQHALLAAAPAVVEEATTPVLALPDTPTTSVHLSPPINPYKGLRAFQAADTADFFGRDALVQRLLARVAGVSTEALGSIQTPVVGTVERFLAVVGPSGSGKSSVVKAGLIPALRTGSIPGSDRWFIIEMLPGTHPLEELEIALLRVAATPLPSLMEQLSRDERGLLRALKLVLPEDDSQLLLVIDQFEEIFTLVEDETARVHFLNSLLAAIDEPRSRLRVIVTLRADFYDKPLLYSDFGEIVRKRTEVVLPLTTGELEQAIINPAQRVNVVFEPGLVATISKDVGEQPGTLPLLQYALTELFEHRDGHILTQVAYQEIGGVTGALAKRAEQLFIHFDESGQETARQLFMRLVTLGEGTEDTRRRALQAELVTNPALKTVIDTYGSARLLTFDRDPVTRGPTLEVAHEALLRTWTRLRGWLDESRDDLRLHRRLTQATTEWEQAGRDPSFLLTGSRLEQYEAWAEQTLLELNAAEHLYLDASIVERNERKRMDEARKAHEADTARRAQTFGRAAAILGIVGILAVIATALAIAQGNTALYQANNAQTQAAIAQGAQEQALALGGTAQTGATEVAANAAYFVLQQKRVGTLAAGAVVVPPGISTPEPTQFVATLTQVAVLNQWQPVEMTDPSGVILVQVPAGCFYMGSVAGADEQPISIQCFNQSFWIDKFEVTNRQYRQVKGTPPPSQFIGDLNPVESISWFDARDFCRLRSAALPTEAQWEYAARGPDGLTYPWGNAFIKDAAVYSRAREAGPLPVMDDAGRPLRPQGASWVGAVDLAGNVYEWASTRYDDLDYSRQQYDFLGLYPYPYMTDDGREEDETQAAFDARSKQTGILTTRVLRGGAFSDTATNLRGAFRIRNYPYVKYSINGFRCARAS